jgi:hypothetical protein
MFCVNWYFCWADALLATSTGSLMGMVVKVRKKWHWVWGGACGTEDEDNGVGQWTVYKPGWSDNGSSLFLHKLSELIHTHASRSRRHVLFLRILSHSMMLYSGTKTNAVGSSTSSGGSEG